MTDLALPYLTAALPGTGGEIRCHLEDFRVEELPLYDPSGEGTHVYFRIEKRGVSTPMAIDRIARYMGVRPTDIGLAGLKDARAVTTQTLSLEHVDPDQIEAYTDAQIRILWTNRHTNKLRPGHLAGNRFTIRLRDAAAEAFERAQAVMNVLVRRGVPNYFGEQRFGARGDTARLGEALLRDDPPEFLALFLGRSQPDDPPDCKAARDAFDAGFFDRAMQRWPRHYANERRALAAFKRSKRPGPAIAAVDKRMRRLYISAFQSELFNEVLTQRIQEIDTVLAGDLAQKTDSGGVFRVEDESVDQPRAAAFEISPTGPLIGPRCNLPGGRGGEVERAVLAAHGISEAGEFPRVGPLKVKGGRRALRFRVTDPAVDVGHDEYGPYLEVRFVAPSGCYATVALREIMKAEPLPSAPDTEDAAPDESEAGE